MPRYSLSENQPTKSAISFDCKRDLEEPVSTRDRPGISPGEALESKGAEGTREQRDPM